MAPPVPFRTGPFLCSTFLLTTGLSRRTKDSQSVACSNVEAGPVMHVYTSARQHMAAIAPHKSPDKVASSACHPCARQVMDRSLKTATAELTGRRSTDMLAAMRCLRLPSAAGQPKSLQAFCRRESVQPSILLRHGYPATNRKINRPSSRQYWMFPA